MLDSGDPWNGGGYRGSYDGSDGGNILGRTIRNVIVLALVCFVIAAVATQLPNLPNLAGHFLGSQPQRVATSPQDHDSSAGWYDELAIRPGHRGHYFVDAAVNGVTVRFLVDTGASMVLLTPQDARRLHLTPDRLDFSETYQTANGTARGAPVMLRQIRIGQLAVHHVEASVSEAPLPISLLGMSFLGQLQGYEVRDGLLILRW